MTLHAATTAPAAAPTAGPAAAPAVGRVTWSEVQPGLHVASRAGEFVGFFERTASGQYVAFDCFATPVGRYDTPQAARTAVLRPPSPRRRERAWQKVAVVAGGVAGMLALTAGALVPFV